MPDKCSKKNCKKKLSLADLTIPCKCNKCFCKKHRFPELHDCSFNFKYNNDNDKIIKLMECKTNKIIKI